MTCTRTFGRDVAFMDWIRTNPTLDSRRDRMSVVDIDVLIHRYRDRHEPNPKKRIDNLLVLETKSHARGPAQLTLAQDDTWSVLNALWRSRVRRDNTGAVRNYPVVVNGERRRVRWWGVHVLAMTGDRPENSDHGMWWNERTDPVSVDMLECLLRFEIDPFTMQKIDYRDHHEWERTRMPLLR